MFAISTKGVGAREFIKLKHGHMIKDSKIDK